MKIQPQSNNAISILLDNGDRFDIHSPNEKEIVISRSPYDKRDYRVDSVSNIDGGWGYQTTGWMICITKQDEKGDKEDV